MSHRFISLSGSVSPGAASLVTSLGWIDLSILSGVSSMVRSPLLAVVIVTVWAVIPPAVPRASILISSLSECV